MPSQPPFDPFQQQDRPSFTPHQGQQPRWPSPGFADQGRIPAVQDQRAYPPQPQVGHRAQRHPPASSTGSARAESFWYVLGCISFGAAYFAKLPTKKAARRPGGG